MGGGHRCNKAACVNSLDIFKRQYNFWPSQKSACHLFFSKSWFQVLNFFFCLWMLLLCSFIMENHYESKSEFTRSSFVNILSTMPSNVFRSCDKILVISVNGWLGEYWLRWAQSFKRSTAWNWKFRSQLINVFLKIAAQIVYFLYSSMY